MIDIGNNNKPPELAARAYGGAAMLSVTTRPRHTEIGPKSVLGNPLLAITFSIYTQ